MASLSVVRNVGVTDAQDIAHATRAQGRARRKRLVMSPHDTRDLNADDAG